MTHRNGHPVVLAVVAVLAFGAGAEPAAAYSKFEHEQLTYYAFELARQLSCESPGRPAACDGFGAVPSTELGVVTRAVDYFSNPSRLAPVAAACTDSSPIAEGDEDFGCRKSMREHCQGLSDACCLEYALQDTLDRVRNRRSNRLYRALAVHRNDEHFRQGARDEYNRMHERALRFVTEKEYGLALLAEAIAIHFLQDGFSPGHLAAPRDQYGDSHAGALHDRANGEGLEMWVGPEVCRLASELEEPLELLSRTKANEFAWVTLKRQREAVDAPVPESSTSVCPAPEEKRQPRGGKSSKGSEQLPRAKQIPPDELSKDLREFTGGSCPTVYNAFGDKRLLEGRQGAAPSAKEKISKSNHRISLLALTVLSIQDVLRHQPPEEPLRVCFHPPSLVSKEEYTAADSRDRYWAPGLAVGRRAEDWSESRLCWRAAAHAPGSDGDGEELIFGYRTEPIELRRAIDFPDGDMTAISPEQRAETRYDLGVGVHRVNGLQAAVSYWGDKRRRFEIGHDMIATEKYWQRSATGELSSDPIGRRAVATGGYVLHYEKERELEVLGAGLLVSSGTQFRDFDIYAAIEPGIGHYRHPSGDTTAFRWSARAGFGLSLVAVEAILERGLEEGAGGDLEEAWRPSVNLRFRLAPSWLKLLFRKWGKG